jgi:hypothetical protein
MQDVRMIINELIVMFNKITVGQEADVRVGEKFEQLYKPAEGVNLEDLIFPSEPDVFDTVDMSGINIDRLRSGINYNELREMIENDGYRCLAWYQSFHKGRDYYGIYITESGITFLALEYFLNLDITLERAFQLAFLLLHKHEIMHFGVDYMLSQLEMLLRVPLWEPGRSLKDDCGYNVEEEKLANGYMLRGFQEAAIGDHDQGSYEAAKKFVLQQPKGYKDGHEILSRSDFLETSRYLALDFLDNVIDPAGILGFSGVDLERLYPFDENLKIDWWHCPIYLVKDLKGVSVPSSTVGFIKSICDIKTTKYFDKQLIKLPQIIRDNWPKTKENMCKNLAIPSLDFKKMSGGGQGKFSVRLKGHKGYRAHLERNAKGEWTGIEIGSHKAMGHG